MCAFAYNTPLGFPAIIDKVDRENSPLLAVVTTLRSNAGCFVTNAIVEVDEKRRELAIMITLLLKENIMIYTNQL